MKKFLIGLIVVLGIAGGYFYPKYHANLGSISIPESPYLFVTSLQSNIGTSDTSMTLNKRTLANGASLTGYQCFTIDTGLATAEYACGTASGTAISSLIRGIDPQNPAATSSLLTFAHRASADVRITDFPILQILKRLSNGQDAFPNPVKLDTSISTTTLASNTSYLATVGYANGIALQGAPIATGTTAGVVVVANGTQLSNGTMSSGGYTLVPGNSFFNFTPQSATTVPVTNASGKLAQGFLDLTQGFTWSGLQTFNTATTTFNATTSFNSLVNFSNQIPTATITTPSLATQLITKNYLDTGVFASSSAPSRALTTDYKNTTGKTLIVSIGLKGTNTTNTSDYAYVLGKLGAATTTYATIAKFGYDTSETNAGSTYIRGQIILIVPNNYYYTAAYSQSGSGSVTLEYWQEYNNQ